MLIKNKLIFLIFSAVIGLLCFYVGDNVGCAYRLAEGDMLEKLSYLGENFSAVVICVHFSFAAKDILWGLAAVCCWALFVLYTVYGGKNLRTGEEHGSARWGDKTDLIANRLIDRKYENNMLFTSTERMSLNTRQTLRNNNALIIGGSGSGKTRFWVKPNILQMHTSFVVTDPKGTLLNDVGQMLVNNGYKIKVFNTVDFSKSMKYNPFSFIRCEADIKVFVDLFISGTKEKGEQSADKFWENAERLLYMALVGYLYFFADPEHRNFAELSRLINLMEVREDDENFKNDVDYMFEEIELGSVAFAEKYNLEKPADEDIIPSEPNNFAVTQYRKYKLAAGKTAKSILISCGVRLAPFDINVVREMTKYDEMELDKIGDEKTALFIIIDDKISSFNFLCAIMYSQLFKDLCDKADNVYHGRLPIHVRCILDEFANCGQIPDFEKIISVIRSREISANVIVQNPAQIKKLYGENAKTIEGCCDSILFLGSSESEVNKYISDKVGKTTIDHRGTSTSKGQNGSYSVSDQIISRELITPAEVGLLPNDECILFIRGIRPFKSKKIRLNKCRNHEQLADFNSEMYFDIKDYNKVMKERKEAEEKAKNGFFDDDSIASAEKKPKMEILDIFDAENKSSGGKNSDRA